MVILNFRDRPIGWRVPDEISVKGAVFVVGNYEDGYFSEEGEEEGVHVLKRMVRLRAFEARVYTLRT